MPTCIDLQERFGRKYRIGKDPAYHAEHGKCGRAYDPWLLTIPCRFGHLFPWGGEYLAAATDSRGPTARALVALPCVEVVQDADDGVTVRFHVDQFAAVAAVMRPKTRRILSESQRATLARNSFRPQSREDGAENEPEVNQSTALV